MYFPGALAGSGSNLNERRAVSGSYKTFKRRYQKLLHNLAECDVKAVPCSKAELFNMLHTHYHPISGNRYHYADLLESNWDSRIMPYREDTDLEESFTDELIDEMLYGGLQNG